MGAPPAPASPAGPSAPLLPWFLRSGTRLHATLVLTVSLLTGLFVYLVSTQIHRALEAQALRHNALIAQLIAPLVADRFASLIHYVDNYARRPRLAAAVEGRDSAAVGAHLKEVITDNDELDRALLIEPDGTILSDYPPVPGVRGRSVAGKEWFKAVAARQATYVSGVHRRPVPPQEYLVAIAAPFFGRHGALAGYLVAQHPMSGLVNCLAVIRRGGGRLVGLLDSDGQLMDCTTSPQGALIPLDHSRLVREALAGRSGSDRLPDPVTGAESLISYSPIAGIGWAVLVRHPISVMAAPIAAVQHAFLGFALVFLLVMIVVAAFWLKAIRRYNRELGEREARFRGLLESAPDAIVTVDPQGSIVLVNSQAEHWFGYGREELLGRSVEMLVPEGLPGAHSQHRGQYLMAPHTRRMGAGIQLKGRCKNGREFPIEVSLSPLKTQDGVLVTAIIRDMSERERQEAALRQYTLELEIANRELESFSYSVSHDLRTPLRAIDGFSHVLLDDCGESLSEECRDYLRRVRSAAQRMAMLIDDLLKLATVTRAELVIGPVNLSRLAEEAIEGLRNAEPEREVEVAITPDLCVNGDERLLRIAMENLMSNAWKYTANRRPARIEFGTAASSDRTVYRLHDNGAGFDMAYADKLFTPFQRLHDQSEFSGTGIGLATVQRILRKHGGQIWAHGTPGQGATFCFTF